VVGCETRRVKDGNISGVCPLGGVSVRRWGGAGSVTERVDIAKREGRKMDRTQA